MLTTALGAAGGIVFFFIAIVLAWNTHPYNPFYAFNTSLYNYFPFSYIFHAALFTAIAFFYTLCVKEGESISDGESDKVHDELVRSGAATIVFAVFMIPATFSGIYVQENFNAGCFQVVPCYTLSNKDRIADGATALAFIVYMPAFLIIMTSIGIYVGSTLPKFIAGLIIIMETNDLESLVKRTLERDRPDRAIAQQLAQIMRQTLINEREAERLLSQLSPFQQWVKRVQYRKRMRDARRLNEMMEAKMQALRAEGDLSRTVHEMEGVRRERDERGGWR